MISVKNLEKYFGEDHVLKNINFKVNDGETIVIIGPSGSGKSTFLRCLNLLETPSSGQIWFDDVEITDPTNDINKIRQKMNMVFQQFNLYNNLTVLKNITLAPIKLKKVEKKQAEEEAMALLEQIDLSDKASAYPSQLSGGQRQRVAIVRSLAMKPKVILFDEPTSALDPGMISEVLKAMEKLSQLGLTMICVTHEMQFAKKVANRVVFMEDGQIVEENQPDEIFSNPQSEKLKSFLSKIL